MSDEIKTDIRNQMDAENPDEVLADLERKHGSLNQLVRRWSCTTSRFQLLDPPRNPFLVAIENFGEGRTTIRTYEFDASSEDECRRLFNEAKRDRLMEVDGFTLNKIEEIAPNDKSSDPAQ